MQKRNREKKTSCECGNSVKFPVQGGSARKRRFWGFSDERKAGFLRTCDVGGVVLAETLPLGIGCWDLGLRENKGYGGVWTGERDIEI